MVQRAEAHGYRRYVGSSVNGEAAIDGSDRQARRKLLAGIVADADRLSELAPQTQGELPADSAQQQTILDGADLRGQLLLHDVKRVGHGDDHVTDSDGGVSLRDGVSKDRIVSVHHPEMRHGHKSSRHRFDGHKAAVVVNTETRLITAPDLPPGKTWDRTSALGLVEQSGIAPGRRWLRPWATPYTAKGARARTLATRDRSCWPRCPTAPTANTSPRTTSPSTWWLAPAPVRRDRQLGRWYPWRHKPVSPAAPEGFRFGPEACGACPLRPQSTSAESGAVRTVRLHSQEALLQEELSLRQNPACGEYLQRRVVAEHRLARVVQLGIRQARYFGRAKTRFQLYQVATVTNLTLSQVNRDWTVIRALNSTFPPFAPIPTPTGARCRGAACCGLRSASPQHGRPSPPANTGFPAEFLRIIHLLIAPPRADLKLPAALFADRNLLIGVLAHKPFHHPAVS